MRDFVVLALVVCALLFVGWLVCLGMKSHSQNKLSGQIRWSSNHLSNEIRKSIAHNKWV